VAKANKRSAKKSPAKKSRAPGKPRTRPPKRAPKRWPRRRPLAPGRRPSLETHARSIALAYAEAIGADASTARVSSQDDGRARAARATVTFRAVGLDIEAFNPPDVLTYGRIVGVRFLFSRRQDDDDGWLSVGSVETRPDRVKLNVRRGLQSIAGRYELAVGPGVEEDDDERAVVPVAVAGVSVVVRIGKLLKGAKR
jgi:hypothetical protein